jgi:hypothetical protein
MHEYIQEWGCVSPTNCSIKKSSGRGGEGSVHLPRPRSQLFQTFFFCFLFSQIPLGIPDHSFLSYFIFVRPPYENDTQLFLYLLYLFIS